MMNPCEGHLWVTERIWVGGTFKVAGNLTAPDYEIRYSGSDLK